MLNPVERWVGFLDLIDIAMSYLGLSLGNYNLEDKTEVNVGLVTIEIFGVFLTFSWGWF